MKKGRLEVIVGCMSSGKSEELIRRLKRALYDKKTHIIVFKPAMDTRTNGESIESRDGRVHQAIVVPHPSEMMEHVREALRKLKENHRLLVGIDEVQFFTESLLSAVGDMVDLGIRVIAAGLDTDFRGEPFEFVAQLMAVSDEVKQLDAVCMQCGKKATRTQRLIAGRPAAYDSPRYQVGGEDLYEARCRDCHEVPREQNRPTHEQLPSNT